MSRKQWKDYEKLNTKSPKWYINMRNSRNLILFQRNNQILIGGVLRWCGYRIIMFKFYYFFCFCCLLLFSISYFIIFLSATWNVYEIKDVILKDWIHPSIQSSIIHAIYQFGFDKEYERSQLLPIIGDCSWQFIIMTVFTSWLMCVVWFLIILQKRSHEMTWFCSMTNNCCYIESENSWNHWKDKQQRPLNERQERLTTISKDVQCSVQVFGLCSFFSAWRWICEHFEIQKLNDWMR